MSLLSKGLQSFPARQFEGINSLALCPFYDPALTTTTIHDRWEDHSLDCTDLCQQSEASAFQHNVWVCHSFPAEKQSPDFMAAVTIHSDFRVQEEETVTASPFFSSLFMK